MPAWEMKSHRFWDGDIRDCERCAVCHQYVPCSIRDLLEDGRKLNDIVTDMYNSYEWYGRTLEVREVSYLFDNNSTELKSRLI